MPQTILAVSVRDSDDGYFIGAVQAPDGVNDPEEALDAAWQEWLAFGSTLYPEFHIWLITERGWTEVSHVLGVTLEN